MEYTKKEKNLIREFRENQKKEMLSFWKAQETEFKVLQQNCDFCFDEVCLLQAQEAQHHHQIQNEQLGIMISTLKLKKLNELKKNKL